MTGKEIKKSLSYWQPLLHLNDWEITVRQGRKSEMSPDEMECEGLNYIEPQEMESIILLKRGAKEEVLLHELLHLVLDGDEAQQGTYSVLHERKIGRLTKALMECKRRIEEG